MFKYTLFLALFSQLLFGSINIIKNENSDSNTTLLVIGGIHGDESGSYFAASILASHYKIESKNLWIIPNLNEDSIINNQRGINGDMNRKFAYIEPNDKDKPIVDELKEIMLQDRVSLILNLHDGHGFYRLVDNGSTFNSKAWGQTCVIDQCKLNENLPFMHLDEIARSIKDSVNKNLLEEHHQYDVKNTKTRKNNVAMQQSLTYFAITHNKPAFALESSKNLTTVAQKVYYHLLAIEKFMDIMEISYKKDFDLNLATIENLIQDYGFLHINDNILLNLTNLKKTLSFVPLKSSHNSFEFSNPIGKSVFANGEYHIYVGNQKVTTLRPQYFTIASDCKNEFGAIVDKKEVLLNKTSQIIVNDDVKILRSGDYRVNLIGFTTKESDESGYVVNKQSFDKRFSVDENGSIYRVEFYKDNEFCFMSTIHFK